MDPGVDIPAQDTHSDKKSNCFSQDRRGLGAAGFTLVYAFGVGLALIHAFATGFKLKLFACPCYTLRAGPALPVG